MALASLVVVTLVVVTAMLGVAAPVAAEEGMWLPTQLDELDLEAAGFQISAEDIYSPDGGSLANAVVFMGATAELVSPDGLLLTNHHVAFFGVQRASTKGEDYLQKGFLARTRDEEIPSPGYSASMLVSIDDVTGKVLDGLDAGDPVARERAINARIHAMEAEVEASADDLSARVAAMYAGRQYLLFVHRRYDDVRLVWVPPRSIGNYGGDIDNWMWPRHTGDFSFLRVYMAPDGSGRDYDPSNVPFKPKRWLKIATDPLKDGDLTFILGYPGRTTRYRTSYDVAFHLEQYYPEAIAASREVIEMLEGIATTSQEASIKTAGLIKGLNNRMKNFQGNLAGMQGTGFLEHKRTSEADLMSWINSDAGRRERYGELMSDFADAYTRRLANRELDSALMRFDRLAGTMVSIASDIYWAAVQRETPELERDPQYSPREVARDRERLKYRYMTYFEPMDKALLRLTLSKLVALPAGQQIEALGSLIGGQAAEGSEVTSEAIAAYVDSLYEHTKLVDPDHAAKLFDLEAAELAKLDDPVMQLAVALYPELEKQRLRQEASDVEIDGLTRRMIEALAEWRQAPIYSDANGTLRFTYGRVRGYTPRDAVRYLPFTTLSGALEKDTGEPPFDMPADLKALAEKGATGRWVDPSLGDVPVAFLHECDITGGNSGSPVLNARGELVGIAFDGNWEALTGDWVFQPEIQRTISVNIRYVMYLAENLVHADNLLTELGLAPAGDGS